MFYKTFLQIWFDVSRKFSFQGYHPMKSTKNVHNRQDVLVNFIFMSTRSREDIEKTFSALTGPGAALFINLALNFRYFVSWFVIPRMSRSLSPEKLWAALKQIFFTLAAFVSSNVLLTIFYNLPEIWLFKHLDQDRKKIINKTPPFFKYSTVVRPTFLKIRKLNRTIEPWQVKFRLYILMKLWKC